MMGLICMFFPAVVALSIDMQIQENKKFDYLTVITYIVYCFLINLFGNTAVWLISAEKFRYYSEAAFNYDFCFKYMWLTFIIAVILPYIRKNVHISLEIKRKDYEKDSKNKKENSK